MPCRIIRSCLKGTTDTIYILKLVILAAQYCILAVYIYLLVVR